MKCEYNGIYFEHGCMATCMIGDEYEMEYGSGGRKVTGRICINKYDAGVYLCQDIRSGSCGAEEKFGYQYSWILGKKYGERLELNRESKGLKFKSHPETIEEKRLKAVKLLIRCGILSKHKTKKCTSAK